MPANNKRTFGDYTFEDLDKDLLDLNDLLQKSGSKIEDKTKLLKPVLDKIPSSKKANTLRNIFCILICLLLLLFVFIWWDDLYWHITAITRILMVKILPYWNWRLLKNNVCLIPKFKQLPVEQFDCNLCENLQDFQELSLVNKDLIRLSVQLDMPLMVNGQIDHWMEESPEVFLKQMLRATGYAHSVPCNLHTNIHNSKLGDPTVLELLGKTQLFQEFFLHFQNCDPDAIRVFRNFTSKPSIIPEEFSPVSYNWLIWNCHYNSPNYKKLDFIERNIVIGQIFGKTRLRLSPRNNCQNLCPVLEGDLTTGFLMLLTSLWDVDYLPVSREGKGHNMAAILELSTGLL